MKNISTLPFNSKKRKEKFITEIYAHHKECGIVKNMISIMFLNLCLKALFKQISREMDKKELRGSQGRGGKIVYCAYFHVLFSTKRFAFALYEIGWCVLEKDSKLS